MKTESRIHRHKTIFNNSLEPESAVYATVEDQVWKQDFDLEVLVTRHLGNNHYLLISIPHLIYGYQRLDVVQVNPDTQIIENLVHRSRNTSVRLTFAQDIEVIKAEEVIKELIDFGFVVDPYNKFMISIDLDEENSRERIKLKMNILIGESKIYDWEYII